MENLEDSFRNWDKGAVVYIDFKTGPLMIRPAAFVFALPGGFCWVEPSYADPWGASSSAWHERIGRVEPDQDGFVLFMASDGGERKVAVYPFNSVDPALTDAAAPLTWFSDHLKTNGLAWQAERERVRALVVPD